MKQSTHLNLLTVLLFVSMTNIILDLYLTTTALEDGCYYETNSFTNSTAPMIHAIVLMVIASVSFTIGMMLGGKWLVLPYTVLIWIGLVWTVNNIISLIML